MFNTDNIIKQRSDVQQAKGLIDRIYNRLDRLPYYTAYGWAIILAVMFLLVPLLLGSAYTGYTFNSTLIQLQSRTNGMEHTTNFKQLHSINKTEEYKNGN